MNITSLLNDRYNADGTIRITRGPALLFANSGASILHTRDDLTLKINAKKKETVSTVAGVLGAQTESDQPEMETKPVGYWGDLSFWFAMLNTAKGEALFTASDKIVDVLGVNDLLLYRFWRGAVISMPDLSLGPAEDLMDTIKFGFVRRAGCARSAANSLYQLYNLGDSATTYYTITHGTATSALAFNSAATAVQAALNTLAGVCTEDMVLTYGGSSSSGLTTATSAANIQTALRALHMDLSEVTVTGDFTSGWTISGISAETIGDITGTIAGSANNVTITGGGTDTQVVTPANLGVVVTGGHDKGGYLVTWNLAGARSTAFTGALTGFPSGAAFSQTVVTAGTSTAREVRLIKITPYMTGYTAALSPIPKLAVKCNWLSTPSVSLTYGANSTAAIALTGVAASDAAALNAAFGALSSVVSAGGATITGSIENDFVVTWTSAGARTAISGTVTNAPPGTSVKENISTTGTSSVAGVSRLKLSPWASFASRTPVKVKWDEKVEAVLSPLLGNENYILAEPPQPKIEMEPDAMLAADALAASALQGDDSAELGAEHGDDAQPLNLINDSIYIRFWKAGIDRDALINWSLKKERVGKLTFEAFRKIESSGIMRPMATVGTSAPS